MYDMFDKRFNLVVKILSLFHFSICVYFISPLLSTPPDLVFWLNAFSNTAQTPPKLGSKPGGRG